jgi:hypothetical protein
MPNFDLFMPIITPSGVFSVTTIPPPSLLTAVPWPGSFFGPDVYRNGGAAEVALLNPEILPGNPLLPDDPNGGLAPVAVRPEGQPVDEP